MTEHDLEEAVRKLKPQKYLLLGWNEYDIIKSAIKSNSPVAKLHNKFVIGRVDKDNFIEMGTIQPYTVEDHLFYGIKTTSAFFKIMGDRDLVEIKPKLSKMGQGVIKWKINLPDN